MGSGILFKSVAISVAITRHRSAMAFLNDPDGTQFLRTQVTVPDMAPTGAPNGASFMRPVKYHTKTTNIIPCKTKWDR